MRKQGVTTILSVLAILLLFGGCSRPQPSEEEETTIADVVEEMENVEDGGFYIHRNGSYQRLYVDNANFEISGNNSSSSTTRTLWFSTDWSRIPTMYRGDQLIYKTSATLKEQFRIERFEYVGYTIGLSNLKQTASGRFSFSTDPDNKNINPASDATQLYDVPTDIAIIDRIGNEYLREGNVSSGGCILGLEEGKVYLAEVYAGTFLNEYRLTADSIALTSMEDYQTVDYEFLRSEILEIQIPDYFHSGYYLVNGFGLFRYVNGSSYDENTDFNIPNEKPSDKNTDNSSNDAFGETAASDGSQETDGAMQLSDAPESFSLVISEERTIRIVLDYTPKEKGEAIPIAYLIGSDKLYPLQYDGAHTLIKELTLPAGNYVVEISGLNGREYKLYTEEVSR